jgi:hypothetical protein
MARVCTISEEGGGGGGGKVEVKREKGRYLGEEGEEGEEGEGEEGEEGEGRRRRDCVIILTFARNLFHNLSSLRISLLFQERPTRSVKKNSHAKKNYGKKIRSLF